MTVSLESDWLSALHPAAVWAHFATLCRIPRQSKQEDALRDHLRQWADKLGLTTLVDEAGNLIIRKPASAGCEGKPGLVLQGHLDMVCQKNSDSTHDFSRDPIKPVLVDGWLKAECTTLGSDNGIGVAMILALLEDTTLPHGPLEALFTVDEEAGMGGAQGLAEGVLQGRVLPGLRRRHGCERVQAWSARALPGGAHGLAHRVDGAARRPLRRQHP
jgi:dipeptidase D